MFMKRYGDDTIMIRPATKEDLAAIAAIYEEILDEEDQRPSSFTNWQRGKYPTIDTAHQALQDGTLWVMEEDGEVCGAANLNKLQLPEYDNIPWAFAADREQAAVIHTLVISPRFAGRGLARQFVTFCEEEGRRQGCTVMRLDTYVENEPAKAMYPKLGYRMAGITRFLFQGFLDEDLICYEKQL